MERNEAIGRLRQLYSDTSAENKAALECLIPELKESKDEKIRKWLITQLENNYKGNYWAINAIAYLEKQKEQKPAEWSDIDNIGWDEAFACVTRAEKAAKNEGELQNAVTAEKWLKEIKFKYCAHPVKQEWSDSVAKEMFIKALERAVEQTKKGYELTDCDKHSWWEDFKAYSEIKPKQEWSEADEKMREHIISDLREFRDCETDEELVSDYENEISWLKSLRHKPNLKPIPSVRKII